MRQICGTIGSVVGAMLVFRIVYGAWPALQGDFWQWITSDTRAAIAFAASLAGIVLGGIAGQSLCSRRRRE